MRSSNVTNNTCAHVHKLIIYFIVVHISIHTRHAKNSQLFIHSHPGYSVHRVHRQVRLPGLQQVSRDGQQGGRLRHSDNPTNSDE